MKISRRNFCLLMAGACCTGVLAACGSSSSSTASSSAASASAAASGEVRDELIFVNYRDIRDLNPHLYAGEMYAQSILYDTLVSITANGYEGCLAESWDISEDGCTYTFHIRPNVLFSDGEKCDANAILANFNAILENRERHTWLDPSLCYDLPQLHDQRQHEGWRQWPHWHRSLCADGFRDG